MSNAFFSADRASRRLFLSALSFAACSFFPHDVDAATAVVRWLPSSSAATTRYDVYERHSGARYDDPPVWSGEPTRAGDGSLSALVTFTPAASGANYFAIVAASAAQESALSGELPTGTPNPCRNDSCSTKRSCDFSARANGTACDDASFCNGAEICRTGVCVASPARNCADDSACTVDRCDEAAHTCTHAVSPSCCPACDTGDPCLAEACAAGDCSALPGAEVEIRSLRFRSRKSGVKLSIKGTFAADATIDPAATGATIELRSLDGTVLHASSATGQAFNAGASGRRYHFVASRQESDPLRNGLRRLDFRRKDTQWIATAQVQTPELREASLEPTLTLVMRLGSTCVRRMNAGCERQAVLSICR